MLADIVVGILAIAFFGAGVANLIGAASIRENFVRWGYPGWWCRITGGLEMIDAALIAFPATRWVGLVLGALIIGAALATVLWHRELSHLAPIGLFVVLLAFGAVNV